MLVTYHQLEPESAENAYLYKVSCAQMEEHLRMFSSLPPTPTECQVTFDDGHISCHQYALPLLEKYKIRAVFFLTGSWIERKPDTMSWHQVRELQSLGHQIQSHSWSHPFLTHCPDDQLREEFSRSKSTLEDKLGVAVDSFAAPYGRWDGRVLRAACAAGYTRFFTSDPWLRTSTQHGISVSGRLTLRNDMTTARILTLITAEGANRIRLQTPFVMKQFLRRVIGDGAYHRLWTWLAHSNEKAYEIQ